MPRRTCVRAAKENVMRRGIHPANWTIVAVFSGSALACSGAGSPTDEPAQAELAMVARPAARLILTESVLQQLRQRVSAGDAAWTALKKRCDDYATGTVYPPNGNAYPGYPNVGQGYQGEEYLPVIRALGLCYRVTTGIDAAAQARYASAGSRVLEAMSTPVSAGGQSPSTDSGYGIRNYGVGMAFGYDWLYPALSSTLKTRVVSSLNTWIDWYDQSGFIKDDPIGNYFAGYFLAKVAAALATDGENSKASTYWNDVVTRMWGKLVKPEFTSKMGGGGWPEGWGYGKKAVLNFAEALWATKTATGLDWWNEVPLGADQARYVMHFAWPSLKHIDDQGTIRSGTNLRPSSELLAGLGAMLDAKGDGYGAVARGFAADLTATSGDDSAAWSKFLYGHSGKTAASYKSESLSHLAPGPGHVGVRSSWATNAVWGALSGGPYINADYSGEQLFNAGGISVVAGDQPILINPTGWLPQNAGTPGEDLVYQDGYGTRQRRLYNTFFVNDASNPYNPGQNSLGPSESKAHIERFEDRGTFVRARGKGLEDQYGRSGSRPVTQYTRDLVYVRPGTFVLFDRTTVAQASADQWLSFHTPVAPVQASTNDSTQRRFDVAVNGTAAGSIRTLLPRSASTTTTALPAGATRLEVHAPVRAAAQQWLSVVTAGSAANAVRLSSSDGNVASANMVGMELPGTRSQVVLFASDQAATGSVSSASYSVQQADGDHVLVDVAPSSTGYAVSATVSGGKLAIRVSGGGPHQVSANQTLSFGVSAAGAVTGGTASQPQPTTPPSQPPPTTPPPSQPPSVPTSTPPSQPPVVPPSPPISLTVSFTQGVNGYSGVRDASIASLYYPSNPRGTVFKDNDTLLTYALDYTAKALLKFDVSSIPAIAQVEAAALEVTFESWVNLQTLVGNFLSTPWNYDAPGFGWADGGAGAPWTTAGIGPGDATGPSFQWASIDASGYQRKSVALDPAGVQRWVQNPAANQGVVLTNPNPGKVLRVFSSEASDPTKRPKLSVTFR
jgi:hypothetical protein